MTDSQRAALRAHRERSRRAGLQRVEVLVPSQDAELVRLVARALGDEATAGAAREALRRDFPSRSRRDLKALLEAAPLEGIDLERSADTGRDFEF